MHMSRRFLGTVSKRRPDTATAQPTLAWELKEAASGGAVSTKAGASRHSCVSFATQC